MMVVTRKSVTPHQESQSIGWNQILSSIFPIGWNQTLSDVLHSQFIINHM